MRPLLIDQEAKNKIKGLILFAEANKISMDSLLDQKIGMAGLIADNPNYNCTLELGYWITYTVEQQVNPEEGDIDVKHLCIRLKDAKESTMPTVPSTLLIMKEFGIESFDTCLIELNGKMNTVEIWEPQTKKPYPGGHFRQVE